MNVEVGSQLRIGGGQDVGGRLCEVVEIRGDNGPRRYLVRWMDTGMKGLVILDRDDAVVIVKAS